ncbi:MAG TPA: 5-(carboxyamino)imidazole ribonucleotide synthase [Thermohalobaculum sp.]|nr:5-(carboxyamino)imidazole ribonucleotide synthase [Thermohalobaculum sp.]
MTDGPLPPGSTIGILGGGQLGRMLAIAAARLGLKCHIYEPGANPPAADVAAAVTTAGYGDAGALARFAEAVDVVTFEFENVPAEAAATLAAHAPVRPNPKALEIAQDRVTEKSFLADLGIPVAPWRAVGDLRDLKAALAEIGTPSILKTRRLGYDGKGQVRIKDACRADAAWDEVAGAPAILEGFVAFQREISVICARGLGGEVVCFDPGENIHRDGILHTTTVPARIAASTRMDAVLMAGKILNALDYFGVMGVEMFQAADGRLLVNEIAPRVHNSGHWTIEACVIDQFQQHIRAVAGWPLGDGARHSDAVMTNLIGADAADWLALAGEGAGLHLYGKAEIRAGRKMGHVTRIAARSA